MALSLSRQTPAADWPQWGGDSHRNMASTEIGLPTTFDPGKKSRDRLGIDPTTTKNIRWIAPLGSQNYSSPVIANGRVFIGTNDEALHDPRFKATRGGVLMCLDEATGKLNWRLVVRRLQIDRSKVSEDFDEMNLGICSTATVDGDRVYIVSNRCEVICLDVHGMANGNDGPFIDEAKFSVGENDSPVAPECHDADILWRFDMLRDLPVFPHDASNCSVLIHGDVAYVGTANGIYDGKVVLPTAPTLIALNKWNGQLLAKDDGQISRNVFHGQWSSPTMGLVNGQCQIVYGGGDGVCYGFEPLTTLPDTPTTLQRLWQFDANPAGYRERGGKPIDYWEVAHADGNLVSPSEIIGTPVFYDGRVYVTIGQDPLHGRGRGALSCIAPTGRGDISQSGCVWQYKDIGRSMSTVSIAEGLLYVAETFGKLHCLDAKTGELQWVHDTREQIWSSTFVADGKVFVGTRDRLVVLTAGRETCRLADIRLGSPIYTVPSAANGVLYVASQRNLWAIREKCELP